MFWSGNKCLFWLKLTLQEDFQGSTFVPPSELTEEEPDHRLKEEVKTYADMNIIIIIVLKVHN